LVTEYHSENQARVQLESELARLDSESSTLRGQLQSAESARSAQAQRLAELEAMLADAQESMASIPDVDIFRTESGFAYRMASELLFDSGSTQIRKQGQAALNEIAKEIISKGYSKVRIDGHTDSDPVVVTKDKYPLGNHQLAAQRALAVFGYLTKDAGVSQEVFTLAAFGPTSPTVSGKTAEAKAKNRRVEIHVDANG